MPRSQEVDEDVIYTDYKRTTQPGDFDSSKPIFNLQSTDLLISETEDDEDVIYTDYWNIGVVYGTWVRLATYILGKTIFNAIITCTSQS